MTAQVESDARTVRAGDVACQIVRGSLRNVVLDSMNLAPAVRVSVRDPAWGTVPGEITRISERIQARDFLVKFSSHHGDADIQFSWEARLEGHRDGTIVAEMNGRALRDFEYGRIGFDVLHPLSWCGKRYFATTERGLVSGRLPRDIAPQRVENGLLVGMFEPYSRLVIEVDQVLSVVFSFEGDLFEMEDQRNWTDASFKTYCTPLALGLTHRAEAGQEIRQRVTLELIRAQPGRPRRSSREQAPTRIAVGTVKENGLPRLGVQFRGDEQVSSTEAELLRRLGLSHVRVDVRPRVGECESVFGPAADAAATLGCPVEIALHLDEQLLHTWAFPAGVDFQLERCLVLVEDAPCTPTEAVSAVRSRLRWLGYPCPVGGGTNGDFADINAARPQRPDELDFVAYSITPQVHAFDDVSLFDTLPVQAATVLAARGFSAGRSIVVSPITLRPRSQLAAVSGEGRPARDVDPRQATGLLAAWTIGSIAQLASAGAESVTYFEAVGPRGLLLPAASPTLEQFPARPGTVFPVYHALEAVTSRMGHPLLDTTVSDGSIACLAFRGAESDDVLVAHLAPASRTVQIDSIDSDLADIYVLEAEPATSAMAHAGHPWRRASFERTARGIAMSLPPYGLIRAHFQRARGAARKHSA